MFEKLTDFARTKIGRRGAFLLFLALLDFGYGYSLISVPVQQRTLDLLLPWPLWGIIWAFVGVACLVNAFRSRDWIAFTLAAAIKGVWGLVMVRAWIYGQEPRGWVGAIIFLSFAFTVVVISSWPEEPPGPPKITLPESEL